MKRFTPTLRRRPTDGNVGERHEAPTPAFRTITRDERGVRTRSCAQLELDADPSQERLRTRSSTGIRRPLQETAQPGEVVGSPCLTAGPTATTSAGSTVYRTRTRSSSNWTTTTLLLLREIGKSLKPMMRRILDIIAPVIGDVSLDAGPHTTVDDDDDPATRIRQFTALHCPFEFQSWTRRTLVCPPNSPKSRPPDR